MVCVVIYLPRMPSIEILILNQKWERRNTFHYSYQILFCRTSIEISAITMRTTGYDRQSCPLYKDISTWLANTQFTYRQHERISSRLWIIIKSNIFFEMAIMRLTLNYQKQHIFEMYSVRIMSHKNIQAKSNTWNYRVFAI